MFALRGIPHLHHMDDAECADPATGFPRPILHALPAILRDFPSILSDFPRRLASFKGLRPAPSNDRECVL